MVKLFLVCVTAIIIAQLKYCTPVILKRMDMDFIQSLTGSGTSQPGSLKIHALPPPDLPPEPETEPGP
jgi:hypothetical protein